MTFETPDALSIERVGDNEYHLLHFGTRYQIMSSQFDYEDYHVRPFFREWESRRCDLKLSLYHVPEPPPPPPPPPKRTVARDLGLRKPKK